MNSSMQSGHTSNTGKNQDELSLSKSTHTCPN